MIVALISGPESPQNVHSYLCPLIDEFHQLSAGISTSGYQLKTRIILCIGDTPAISKLAGFCGHNAWYCCCMCEIEGIYSCKYMHYYYPNTNFRNAILLQQICSEAIMLQRVNDPQQTRISTYGLSQKPEILWLKGISWTRSLPLGTMHLLLINIPILRTRLYVGKFKLDKPFEIPEKFMTNGKLLEQTKCPTYFSW